jgi:hypothetical protein
MHGGKKKPVEPEAHRKVTQKPVKPPNSRRVEQVDDDVSDDDAKEDDAPAPPAPPPPPPASAPAPAPAPAETSSICAPVVRLLSGALDTLRSARILCCRCRQGSATPEPSAEDAQELGQAGPSNERTPLLASSDAKGESNPQEEVWEAHFPEVVPEADTKNESTPQEEVPDPKDESNWATFDDEPDEDPFAGSSSSGPRTYTLRPIEEKKTQKKPTEEVDGTANVPAPRQVGDVEVGIDEHQVSAGSLFTEGLANCIAIAAHDPASGQTLLYHYNTIPSYTTDSQDRMVISPEVLGEVRTRADDALRASGAAGPFEYSVVLGNAWVTGTSWPTARTSLIAGLKSTFGIGSDRIIKNGQSTARWDSNAGTLT